VRTFFRRCPSCGRRFEIRLVSKKLISSEQIGSTVEEITPISAVPPVLVESEVPLVVEVDDFRYTYKCKHCGHQWSEERFKTQNEKLDQNVTD